MRKLLRFIAVSVAVWVVIATALALAIPHLLDPNDYKDRLGILVKERTGHTLAIDGEIKLAVFPWVALELGPLRLSNAPGFASAPLAQARHASVRIRLWPLLRKQVRIAGISIDGLRVRLARDARGQVNWQGLLALSGDRAAVGSAMELREIGGIELHDAQLEWDDRRAGDNYAVSDLNVHVGRFAPGMPFAVSVGGTVASGRTTPAYRFQLSGGVTADPSAQRYQARAIRLALGLPQGGTVTLRSAADFDLARQSLLIPSIELGMNGAKLTGKLQGSRILDNPDLRGELQLASFSPRELLAALGKPLPASADPAVLSKASGTFSLRAGRDRVTLQSLTLRLDDSTISGELSIHDFAKARYGFDLELDAIDVDRYLPPPAVDMAAAPPWPVATLSALNLDGNLHIGRLQAYRLRGTDLRVMVKSTGGEVRVEPTGAGQQFTGLKDQAL